MGEAAFAQQLGTLQHWEGCTSFQLHSAMGTRNVACGTAYPKVRRLSRLPGTSLVGRGSATQAKAWR
eukprot:3160114-Alexandrium_andersonii.AAC.1